MENQSGLLKAKIDFLNEATLDANTASMCVWLFLKKVGAAVQYV